MTDSTQHDRIEVLVRQWRTAEQSGRRIPLEELCSDCPELIPHVSQKLGLNDATLNLEVTGSVASTASQLPEQIGDFRIVQLLGQGGMGQSTSPKMCDSSDGSHSR